MKKIMLRLSSLCVVAIMVAFTLVTVEASTATSTVLDNLSVTCTSQFYGYQSLVNRSLTDGQPAYNYSVNLLKTYEDTGSRYRAFIGGRWKSAVGDGDHVLQYTSGNGAADTWAMWSNEPEFYQGKETGQSGTWYQNNSLEPEVLNTAESGWIMYSQVEIDHGAPIDVQGLYCTATQADRIQLFTSTDCKNWTRKTDRGVIVNVPDPGNVLFRHEEVIYVPWDKDGKKFWMYVAIDINDVYTGYWRMRTSDYTTFDYSTKESVQGYSQIGNQVGYFEEAPGGPLFTRITFTDYNSRSVPALQFSRDGLSWWGSLRLEGSSDNNLNKNCYFLGISTINGTGKIEYNGNNQWNALYAASTSNSPVLPDIWYSKIGHGSLTINLNSIPDVLCVNRIGANSTEAHKLSSSDNYQSYNLHASTLLGQSSAIWQFLTGDYNNDGIKDLYCILRQGATATEIHVLNGSDNYQSWLAHTSTALQTTDSAWEFALSDYNLDGKLDLYCILKESVGGKMEVHVLDGASDFQNYLLQTATILDNSNYPSWSFDVGDYNNDKKPDVYCINRSGGSGKTEVHVLNGANNFQSYLLQTATILDTANSNWEFKIGYYNNDNILDLFCINRQGANGKTDFHVLDGSSNYSVYSLHSNTILSTTDANWSFCTFK